MSEDHYDPTKISNYNTDPTTPTTAAEEDEEEGRVETVDLEHVGASLPSPEDLRSSMVSSPSGSSRSQDDGKKTMSLKKIWLGAIVAILVLAVVVAAVALTRDKSSPPTSPTAARRAVRRSRKCSSS